MKVLTFGAIGIMGACMNVKIRYCDEKENVPNENSYYCRGWKLCRFQNNKKMNTSSQGREGRGRKEK